MQHPNNITSTTLHIAAINVELLQRLSDLPKYGVDAVSMSTLPGVSIAKIIDDMEEYVLNNDRVGFIKLAQHVVKQNHLFNLRVHRILICGCSGLNFNGKICNQYKQACINYKNLLIKLINLNINECNLYQNRHNHKKIPYMSRKQEQMHPAECVWCNRGCNLFNQLFVHSLGSPLSKLFTYPWNSIENWNAINFYDCNFNYCPLHLTKSVTVESSIVKHCLNTKYSHGFHHDSVFAHMLRYIIFLGGGTISSTQNMIQSMHLATVILDLMIKLMSLTKKNIEIVISLIMDEIVHPKNHDEGNPNYHDIVDFLRAAILSTFHLFCDYSIDCKLYKLTWMYNQNPFDLIKNYEIEYSRFRSICSNYKHKQLQVGDHDVCKFNAFEKAMDYFVPSQLKNCIEHIVQCPHYPIVKLHILRHNFSSSQFTNKLICGTTPYLAPNAHNNYQQAKDIFDKTFATMLKTHKYHFNSNWKGYYYVYTLSDIFSPFLGYSMFLFDIGSNKGCKYFEYCLNIRPLSGYLHFQYSMYLFQKIKDYRLSYYHLKLAKKLGSNIYTLGSNTKTVLEYENQLKYMTKLLCLKLNKQYRCDCISCDKIISKDVRARVCKGCRSAYYCNKKCQKIDWCERHKNICVSKFVQPLHEKEYEILKRAHFMMSELIKQL